MLLLLACTLPELPGLPPDEEAPEPVDSEPEDSEPVEDTGWDGGPLPWPEVDYDCDALPTDYTPTLLPEARAWHGMAFDEDGALIGWNGLNALEKSRYEGSHETWVPGLQGVEQMVLHPNGDLFMVRSDLGGVFRVTPGGGSERVGGSLYYGYGITLGPDGMLYVADGNLLRIDPASGDTEELFDHPLDDRWLYRDVAFNLDSTVMYLARAYDSWVYTVALGPDLEPLGEPQAWVKVPGGWKDGLQVDACGYVWLPDFQLHTLFRVSPDGSEVLRVLQGPELDYGHGSEWGGGAGGWRQDALYLPLPYNEAKVQELVIGVPDGRLVRTWKGEKARF